MYTVLLALAAVLIAVYLFARVLRIVYARYHLRTNHLSMNNVELITHIDSVTKVVKLRYLGKSYLVLMNPSSVLLLDKYEEN
ncbi:hypothetical protein Sarmat_00025 [Rickettsiales endosymbiont of Paramecium tredecaurelia]|nr:hypothetical protein [Candidatus Sarmatiella mevalonica]